MIQRACLAVVLTCAAACNEPVAKPAPEPPPVSLPPILIDGSSTVLPITREVLKLFAENVTAEIKLAGAGTSAGIKKLCSREITIADASRPIREAETELCSRSKLDLIELPVAFDGIALVVGAENDWAKDITVTELKKLWSPEAEGKVSKWSDVRSSWPAKPIKLFGPGRDSGTFDYFTESIVGRSGASRADYVASEDDEVLVSGVSSDKYALGYFGYSYYVKNAKRLKVLAVDDGVDANGKGPILPTPASVSDASYQPLSRPLFLYTSVESAQRKEVDELIRFYLRAARIVAADVGAVPLPDSVSDLTRKRFVARHVGSAFKGLHSPIGITIEDLLRAETAELVDEPEAQRR
jgi:phosphate transport system substrate-binding protein